MRIRSYKIILITLAIVLVFLIGKYNKEVTIFFFNTDSYIGLLYCVIFLLSLYIGYQIKDKYEIKLRLRENQNDYNELLNENYRLKRTINLSNERKAKRRK